MKANSALEPFRPLVGKWKTTGSHPLLPGVTLHGRASFEWLEGGAFLLMRSEIDEPRFPKTVAIFTSDDAVRELYMLTYDDRGVSRKYDVAVEGRVIKYWRTAPEFSQRYSWTLSPDGRTILQKGELSKDGKTWDPDLDLTYIRV